MEIGNIQSSVLFVLAHISGFKQLKENFSILLSNLFITHG
jgi:hypothetical protein